ncbi:Alpha/beta hydrolase family-domain-containing protein [Coniochaeta sp. 2T2.1]|nr:Alpha/beta hydrolase family-domain-containing protein [Coniochaeta sp. 2T2.1]
MSDPPTLVFVPGAWHKPTCYNKITKLLQERHKLKCVAVTLPSTTGNPAATFKDDLDAAHEAISRETSAGRDVVVVAHSYGGMVGNSAIKGFARPPPDAANKSSSSSSPLPRASTTLAGWIGDQSQTRTASGHVIGLILIASGFTLTGMSFMDPFFDRPPPAWRVNKETGFADIVTPPRELFYHDVPAEEAEYWVSQLTPQSLKALFEGGEYSYAGWMDVPAWYIGTVEDRGLPVVAQRLSVGMAREMGASVEHREMQTSHSPFLSQPEETVGIMLDAVEAFTGKPVEHAPTKSGRGGEIITVPAARLWQPRTWYKFGLPLVLGHILGRCYLVFRWGRGLFGSR